MSIYQEHSEFQVLDQAFPKHLSTTVPTAPQFADEKPGTYKGWITCSVSHNKQTAKFGTNPHTDLHNHPVCSRETQKSGASSYLRIFFSEQSSAVYFS